MPRSSTTYLVTAPQEDGSVGAPSPPIPTTGYRASALDVYRVQDIHQNGFIGTNSCFTDIDTCRALAQVVEGELTHHSQLASAETALQVLLFHDHVDVLVPAVKVLRDKFLFYSRGQEERSTLTFELFQPCDPQDHLICQELVRVEGDIIAASTLRESKMVGRPLGDIPAGPFVSHSLQSACYPTLCGLFEVPGYFSNPGTESLYDNRGFLHRFYEKISVPWAQHMSSRPTTSLSISLPPLLAVVLSRALARDKIPEAIKELRAILEEVRKELRGFNLAINSSHSEAEVQAEVKRLNAVFEAVVPAALQTNIERRQRTVMEFFTIAGALKAPFAYVAKLLNPSYEGRDVRALVSKTITSQTFSGLLSIEPVAELCEEFFTKTELRSMHASYERDRSAKKPIG